MKQIGLFLVVFLMGVWLLGCTAGEADDMANRVQAMMDGDEGAYVVLTLPGALDAALAQQLEAVGIILYDPLGEYRFQAYVPQTAVSSLSTLRDNKVIVDVTAIDPATKMKGEFTEGQTTYAIVVHFYSAPTESETAVLSDIMVVAQTAVGVMNFVEGQATGAQIKQLVELPFVKLVEEAVVSTGGDGS